MSLFFLLGFLFSCGIQYSVQSYEAQLILLDSVNAPKDSAVKAMIEPFRFELEKEMNTVIGYSEKDMRKATPEGLLNNLVADIVFQQALVYLKENQINIKPDICLLNMGGLRADLPKGHVKVSNIFEIMPFDNLITVITLNAEQMIALFDYVAKTEGMPLSGAKMGIKDGKAENIYIGDNPFRAEDKNYYVVTSDYLADGGDSMIFFADPVARTETSYYIRDAIIDYIVDMDMQGKKINAELDKRIYFE